MEDMRPNHRDVLLLSSGYEVMRTIHWKKAISLYFKGKADIPGGYDHHHTIITNRGEFLLPSALVLCQFVSIPYHSLRPTRKNIFRRDGLRCQYSGKQLTYKTANIDHVLPRCRGGKNTWENMVTCDPKINLRKGDCTPKEAGLKFFNDREPSRPSRSMLVIGGYPNMESWKRFIYN